MAMLAQKDTKRSRSIAASEKNPWRAALLSSRKHGDIPPDQFEPSRIGPGRTALTTEQTIEFLFDPVRGRGDPNAR